MCDKFVKFIDSFCCKNIVLGCTEFPLLLKHMKKNGFEQWIEKRNFIDPIDIMLDYLKVQLY